MEKTYHHTHPYLLNPTHKITVNVVGVGGTGSRVVSSLALIDRALRVLGHPGIHVSAFDDDNVSEANVGRQVFSSSDIGLNKAGVIINRINRMLGLAWEFYPYRYDQTLLRTKSDAFLQANILITAVDSLESRRKIKNIEWISSGPEHKPYYWLDIGNGRRYGQYILSTLDMIEQPFVHYPSILLDSFELHPELIDKEDDDDTPSCSLAQALTKQDLFINPIMATHACHMLWRLLSEGKLDYQGSYLNLETLQNNPIKL
jgi:PRTRC genetic system ThiF family protein